MSRLRVTILVVVAIIAVVVIAVGAATWNSGRQDELPYVNTVSTTTDDNICIHPTGLVEHHCP